MPGHEIEPLTFISGDAKSHAAQEAIRVHVMRRQHRHRKLQRQQQQHAKSSVARSQPEALPIAAVLQAPAAEISPMPTVIASDGNNSTTGACISRHGQVVASSKRRPAESPHLSTFPALTKASGHHPAPAGSSSAECAENILVQYYLQSMGVSSLSMGLVRTYSKTAATYNTFLAIVATRMTKEKGIPPPIDPAHLENLAIREVAEQLPETAKTPATGTMLAVALFAHLRESQDEHDKAKMHWNALRRMVAIHGGLESLRQAAGLYTMIFWTEGIVLSSVPCSIGQSCDDFDAVLHPTFEVLRFLEDINRSMTSFRAPRGRSIHLLTDAIKQTLARPVSKVELFSLNEWRQAGLACLIFFAVLALATAGAVQMSSTYTAVEAEVLERGKTYTVRPEELYYILVERDSQNESIILAPKVARLVNAIKRFDNYDRHSCHGLLSAYLGCADPWVTDRVSQDRSKASVGLSPAS